MIYGLLYYFEWEFFKFNLEDMDEIKIVVKKFLVLVYNMIIWFFIRMLLKRKFVMNWKDVWS